MNCRLCGKNARNCGGYLIRVNEKGVEGIWECRPNCIEKMKPDDALIMMLEEVEK